MVGVSNRWVNTSLSFINTFKEQAHQLTLKTVIFQPTVDKILLPGNQNSNCAAMKDCQVIRLEGSKHELFLEADRYRNQLVNYIEAHFL